jgi:dTDP-4-amino-4,6-dideoxygalactose transaminase
MQQMLDAGIATRRGIMLAHREPPYAEHGRRFHLPNSEQASDRSLLLPLYPQMTASDQGRVVEALQQAAATLAR